MPEECSPPRGGWTIETLATHLTSEIQNIKDSASIALIASDRALTKADAALEKRLDALNEFRGALSDQSAKFLPRDEYVRVHEYLAARVSELGLQTKDLEAREAARKDNISSSGVMILAATSVMSMLVSAASLLFSIYHR